MRALGLIVIIIWALAAGYVAISGWMACATQEATFVNSSSSGEEVYYDGISFQNKQAVADYRRDQQDARLFRWIFEVPQELVPFLTALACGMVGGLAPLLRKLRDGHAVNGTSLIAAPLFSGVVGMMLFFVLYLAPEALVSGSKVPRSLALVAISVFGGVFSDPAFAWIEDWVRKTIFTGKKKAQTKKKSQAATE